MWLNNVQMRYKYSKNVIQIQYKCDTNKVQMWRKWNINVIQIQYKYSTNTVQIGAFTYAFLLTHQMHPPPPPSALSSLTMMMMMMAIVKGVLNTIEMVFIADGKLFIFGTFSLSENAISKTLPHLKNRICHPCLPSCRHPWIFSAQGSSLFYHLKIKESTSCLRVFSGRLPFFWKAAFSFSRTSSRVLSPPGVIAFEQRKCL